MWKFTTYVGPTDVKSWKNLTWPLVRRAKKWNGICIGKFKVIIKLKSLSCCDITYVWWNTIPTVGIIHQYQNKLETTMLALWQSDVNFIYQFIDWNLPLKILCTWYSLTFNYVKQVIVFTINRCRLICFYFH